MLFFFPACVQVVLFHARVHVGSVCGNPPKTKFGEIQSRVLAAVAFVYSRCSYQAQGATSPSYLLGCLRYLCGALVFSLVCVVQCAASHTHSPRVLLVDGPKKKKKALRGLIGSYITL